MFLATAVLESSEKPPLLLPSWLGIRKAHPPFSLLPMPQHIHTLLPPTLDTTLEWNLNRILPQSGRMAQSGPGRREGHSQENSSGQDGWATFLLVRPGCNVQSRGSWEGEGTDPGLESQNDLVKGPFPYFQKALSACCMPGLF